MKRIVFALAALALVLAGLPQTALPHAAAQANNSYTNATWGYSVTWDESVWFAITQDDPEQQTDLLLSNGISFVSFAADDTIPAPPLCVTLFESGISSQQGVTNVQPVLGADGNPVRSTGTDRAFVAFSFTVTSQGQTIDVTEYFECRTLVPFQAVLIIDHFVIPSTAYANEVPLVDTLLANLTIPSTQPAATPTPAPTEEAVPTAAATSEPTTSARTGEPGPVFVSGAWRISIVAAVRSPGLNAIGLQRKEGKDWIVLVADVTNWTDQAASIIPRNIRLAFPEGGNPLRAAPSSSGTAAKALGVALTNVSDEQTFRANQTRRAVLAYSVDEHSTDPTISFGTTLPIADVLAQEFDLENLPTVRRPPRLIQAEVDQIRDGDTLDLFLPDEDANLTVNLLSVVAPADGGCFANEAAERLSELAGTTVFLESAGDDESTTEVSRYVWTVADDGTRIQINREMLAGGFAVFQDSSATRFSTWLHDAEREARDQVVGLWKDCADDLPVGTEAPAATATANPTELPPTPTTEPTATPSPATPPSPTTPTSPTATTETGAFEVELVDIAYRPTELTIPADTDVTITLVNSGATIHTFNIDELNVHSGDVPPGQTATITINAPAGDYEYYCSVPGHKEAGMVGTLHVVATAGTPEGTPRATTTSTAGTTEEPTSAMFRGGPSHQGVQPGPGLGAPVKFPWEFQTTSAIFSSPAIVDGVVYVGSLDGSLYALGSNSGPAIWQFTTGAGILSSPAVADGVVYVGSEDTNLYAVDAATGRERWRFATNAEVSSSPAVVDGVVYVGGMDTFMYAVDARTGDELWKVRVGQAFSSPAVVDGVVYIGAAQTLFALDAKSGEEKWRAQTGGPVESSPAVVGDSVFIGNDAGSVIAVDRESGTEKWRFEAGDAVISSPAVANGVVYFGSNDQNVYALDAATGLLIWSYQTGDQVTSSPAVADGVVFIGSFDGYIYGLDAVTGAERWRFQAGPVLASPSFVDGVVYFGSADGRLLGRQPFNLLNLGG